VTKDQKSRQKSLERRAAKQKQRKEHTRREVGHVGPQLALRAAAAWPLHECLISRDWKSGEDLVQILVARQSPSGSLAGGVFLVDLGCLGVKSAFASLFRTFAEYEALRQRVMSTQPLVHGDLDTAAKLIREAIAYARRLGFEPDPDYWEASILLADANADASNAQIPLGRNGKPFFVAGPYDNAAKIIAKLSRAVGPGNFDYVVPIAAPPEGF
jgi:hypothetical protein